MILLQGQGIARHFGVDVLFENISIDIQDTSRIALVGRNGTGKSTLLKILSGIEDPTLGTVSKKRDISIGYLDQYASIESDNTIWGEMSELFTHIEQLKKDSEKAAIALGDPDILADEKKYQQALKRFDQLQLQLEQSNAYGYESEIKMVLHGFGFYEEDYQTPIKTLSGGQRTRLALAKILLEKHDILILDEPTNHLDIETLTWLEDYLRGFKAALLIVSHDQYFLDRVCNEVYEIHHHTAEHYKGNYSYYLEERENRFLLRQKAYEKQQDEIHKLEEFVAKNLVRASTTKRAQSRRKQLEKMERIEKPLGDGRSARFAFSSEKESGKQVLLIENGVVGYENTPLTKPINLQVRKQEAIAVVGPNGVGKSTLLKSLLNEIPFISGQATFGTNVEIGYYDQNLSGLNPRNSVLEELWSNHSLMNEKDIRTILGSFLFTGKDVEKTTAQLSGGEKARLSLAKLALNHDNVLFLDEPTNHLDIDSKEVLEQALVEFDGTIFFVSHDRYFINQVATSILELTPEQNTLYLGDYDYYIEKKKEQMEVEALLAAENKQTESTTTNTNSEAKMHYQQTKEQQKQLRALQRKVDQSEQTLADIDQKISAIHNELAKEEVYTDMDKSSDLQYQLGELEEQQLLAMDTWETLSLELEELNAE